MSEWKPKTAKPVVEEDDGWQPKTAVPVEEALAPLDAAPARAPDESAAAKLRAAMGNMTYGLADEGVAALETLAPSLKKEPWQIGDGREMPQRSYAENKSEEQALQARAEADNPGSAIMGGVLAPDPTGKFTAATKLGKVGLSAARGMGATALQNFGDDRRIDEDLDDGALAGGALGVAGLAPGAAKKHFTSVKDRILAERAGDFDMVARDANDAFNKRYETAAEKQTAKILKGQDREALKAEVFKESLKRKVYSKYAAAAEKTGASPEQVKKILAGDKAAIEAEIEAEFRKAFFGKYAKDMTALHTQIRNAEPAGAQWTPEQQETVDAAKDLYVTKAGETVDKGIPVPPKRLTPEELQAEVIRRSEAAKARGVRSVSKEPASLDPALVDDLAQKRLEAMKASGLDVPQAPEQMLDYGEARTLAEGRLKELPTALGGFAETAPAVYPRMDPATDLTKEGWSAVKDIGKGAAQLGALSAGGYGALGMPGGALGPAAMIARILSRNELLKASQKQGLQYLGAKGAERVSDEMEGLGRHLVPGAAMEASDTALSPEDRAKLEAYLMGLEK